MIQHMTEVEKLAKIIKDNPGAVASIDNSYWILHKPFPPGYDEWKEDRQEEWYESGILAESDDFPSLGYLSGYGLLEAFAVLCKIKVEGVIGE